LYFDKPWTETRDLLVEQGFKEELDKDHHLLYLRKDTESYIIDFEKDTTHSITHYYLGNSKIVNGIYYLWVQNLKSHGFKLSTDKEYEFEHYTARIYVSDTNDGLQMLGLIIEH
jgi:hypothetical protein